MKIEHLGAINGFVVRLVSLPERHLVNSDSIFDDYYEVWYNDRWIGKIYNRSRLLDRENLLKTLDAV
jgi:hypothetical protein